MVSGVAQIMKNGRFDPRQLATSGLVPEVGPEHRSKVGIYLRIYTDVQSNAVNLVRREYERPRDAIYVGQTIDFQFRKTCHEGGIAGRHHQSSNHYKVGRTAERRYMLPIMLFSTDDPDIGSIGMRNILDVAELTAVCLFQSWYPLLLRDGSANITGSFIQDIQNASTCFGLMEEVRQRTGWSPKRLLGLNWLTPALEGSQMDEKIWISWYDPDRQAYLYRCRCRVTLRREGREGYVLFRGSHAITIPDDILKVANFTHGDPISMHVELQNDGTQYLPHDLPYARLPGVCRNPEFERLRSMSIQLHWLDRQTNIWKGAVVQRTILNLKVEEGEASTITQGMMLLSTLLQTSYRNAPAWMPSLGRATVRPLIYDHLEQNYTLGFSQAVAIRDWPPNNTPQENTARLRRMIPSASLRNTVFGVRPARMKQNRKSCDLCYSPSSVSLTS